MLIRNAVTIPLRVRGPSEKKRKEQEIITLQVWYKEDLRTGFSFTHFCTRHAGHLSSIWGKFLKV